MRTDDENEGLVSRITASLGGATSWIRARVPGIHAKPSGLLLADDDHESAEFPAWSELQEQPSFDADDRKRQFAMHDDVDDRKDTRSSSADTPRAIEETEAPD